MEANSGRLPIVKYLPFLSWITGYQRQDLPGDFIAGLTVATMIIPQSMAYALLAGLPPVMGLYTAILPMLIYGLLGSSGFLTLGPTAITSVMVLSSIGHLAELGTPAYIALSLTLTLTLAGVFLLMGVFRLGFIVNLLSPPVLAGYVNAAALIIIMSQVQNITGIQTERASQAHVMVWRSLQNLDQLNWITLAIGLGCVGLLFYFRGLLDKHLKRFGMQNETLRFIITRSGPLMVVLIGLALVYGLNLNETMDVRTIGDVPAGLPQLGLGELNFSAYGTVLLGAIAIAFVGFMEDVSTAKTIAAKNRDRKYTLDPNQEFIAMGVANLASAFSGGLACTTSISRSAVNHAAGARTGLSSVIASVFVALVLVFLAPMFYWLPQAALAAIILMSVIKLVDPSTVRHFRRYSRGEPIPFIVTFLGTFFFNIAVGIAGGIVISIVVHLWRTSKPRIVRVERVPHTEEYREARRTSDTQLIPGVLIMRIDESLYFANIQHTDNVLRSALADRPEVRHLILVCNGVNTADASAIQFFIDLIEELEGEQDVKVYFAELKDWVRERMDRVNFSERLGEQRFYSTTHEAVEATGLLQDHLMPI